MVGDMAGGAMTPEEGLPPGSKAHYAARYARAGFPVLPLHWLIDGHCSCGDAECRSAGKHPLTVEGLFAGANSATRDIGVLVRVFDKFPDANIGIAIPEDMIAIDVDPRHNGDITISSLESKFGKLPDTAMQLTGGGGQHYLYRKPAHIKIAGKLGVGVDVKSRGGYIVAEPSIHVSGTAYVWEASSDPLDGAEIAACPQWILTHFAAGETSSGTSAGALHYGVDERVIEELRSGLAHLNVARPELCDDRDTWVRFGMACKSIGEAGFAIWDEWSRQSSKYDAEDQYKKWRSFNPSAISYRTIFHMAQQAGWRNPLAGQVPDGHSVKPDGQAEPSKRNAFRFDDVSELVGDIKPIQWLVRDYLEDDSLVLLYGPPGSAKSFAAVDMAACVATGTPWLGRKVKTGPVFYLAGEGHNGLARRFRAWEVERGVTIPEGRLWKSAGAAQMLDPESVEAVAGAIADLANAVGAAPALIVLDTLARNFGPGDENSTMDMSNFIDAIDRHLLKPWRCCVMIVHHSGHNQERARGSSALKAAVDAEHEVTRDESGAVKVRTTKMKDAEIPGELLLRLKSVELPGVFDEDGLPVTSAVLEQDEATSEPVFMKVAEGRRGEAISARQVLEVIAGGWMPYGDLAATLGCAKSTAHKAVKGCVKLGLLEADGPGFKLSEQGAQGLSRTGHRIIQQATETPKSPGKIRRFWEEND